MDYIASAFDAICTEAQETSCWYVCLMQKVPYYGGPEEGGWWGSDHHCVKYQEFPTEELAQQAKERVQALADELSKEELDRYGDYCLRSTQWLEDRGLDADFLPEPDGPDEYYVTVCESIPISTYGSRQYC